MSIVLCGFPLKYGFIMVQVCYQSSIGQLRFANLNQPDTWIVLTKFCVVWSYSYRDNFS